MERCRREIAEIESLVLAGHIDLEGLVLALSDWSAELRLLKKETEHAPASGEDARPDCTMICGR